MPGYVRSGFIVQSDGTGVVHGQDRDLSRGRYEGHGVVDGAPDFPAAVPGDHDSGADPSLCPAVRHEQNGGAADQ